MTVRAKTELHKALATPGVAAIHVKSNVTGELQIQAISYEGKMESVFVPSSVGRSEPRLVNLLDYAPASSWRKSTSLLAAVRLGHLSVTLSKTKD